MKVLVGLLLFAGALFALLYYTGMFEFNPAQQAADARAAVKPGMSWDKVIGAVSPPKEYRIYVKKIKNIAGQQMEVLEPGPSLPFDRENLANRLADGSLPGGFDFTYVFSNSEAFTVHFDENGDVAHVSDSAIMKKLLDM